MSRYLYKKIQNISPESLNFQHSGLKLTTLWSDPNVVTDIYLTVFPIFPGICTVCMHDRRKQHICADLRSASVFKANSRFSLLIIPLEIFSFPPVRSDRNPLLLSMDVQHVHVHLSDCCNKHPHGIPLHPVPFGYLPSALQWFLRSF